jgi:hypothetical protein
MSTRYELKYRVPVGFEFWLEKSIDSLEIYVKKPNEEAWKEAIVEKKVIESWGGMWKECGGSRYVVRVRHPDMALPVAEGEHSYQACIPTAPKIKNYALTTLKFLTLCDMKIITNKVTYVFHVRYLHEFEIS